MIAGYVLALLLPQTLADVELGIGAGLCGANGAADCEGAGTGWVSDLRGRWWATPWLGLGAGATWARLPAGDDTGDLLILGPEAELRASLTDTTALLLGVRVAYDRLSGTRAVVSGLGAMGVRVGARHRPLHRLQLGIDYGLTRPRFDERCRGGRCGSVSAALLHRFSLVVGVPFW